MTSGSRYISLTSMDFVQYVIPDHLKINCPSNWINVDRKDLPPPIYVAFLTPPPAGERFKITESDGLYISITNLESDMVTLVDWVNNDLQDMRRQYQDFILLDSFPRTIPIMNNNQTVPAYQVVYSQSGLKTMLVMSLRDKKSYLFNYSSVPENYERYYPIIDQMISSIEFLH